MATEQVAHVSIIVLHWQPDSWSCAVRSDGPAERWIDEIECEDEESNEVIRSLSVSISECGIYSSHDYSTIHNGAVPFNRV